MSVQNACVITSFYLGGLCVLKTLPGSDLQASSFLIGPLQQHSSVCEAGGAGPAAWSVSGL